MKASFLAVCFVLFTSLFISATASDSLLLQERRSAMDKYNAFITVLPDSSPTTLRSALLKADSLLKIDNEIIAFELPKSQAQIDTLSKQNATLKEQVAAGQELTENIEKYKYIALGGIGALVFFMLLFLIMYLSKVSSSKKKHKKLQKQLKETEDDKSRVAELESAIETQKNEHLVTVEKMKHDFANDKSTLERKNEELNATLVQKDSKIKEAEASVTTLAEAEKRANEFKLQASQLENKVSLLTSERDQALQNQNAVGDQYVNQLREKEELLANLQQDMQKLKRENNELILASHNIQPVTDNSSNEELEKEMQAKTDEIEKLSIRLKDLEESSRFDYDKLKGDYDRLIEENKQEREFRVDAERRLSEQSLVTSTENGGEDIQRLRRELDEERAFRREVEKILEQLLKK